MTIITCTCDMCGKNINSENEYTLQIVKKPLMRNPYDYSYNQKDICSECHDRLLEFIDMTYETNSTKGE